MDDGPCTAYWQWANPCTCPTFRPAAPSEHPAETQRDGREPQPCPKCGELCAYDGWDHVHDNGFGIGSCAARLPADTEKLRRVRELLSPNGVPLHDSKRITVGDLRAVLDAR